MDHLRRGEVMYSYFEKWLNIPEGFKITAMRFNDFDSRLELKITCPSEDKYEIHEGDAIPVVNTIFTTNEYGIVDKMWWPELGQEEPD